MGKKKYVYQSGKMTDNGLTRARLVKYVEKGLNDTQIGSAFGSTRQAVHQLRKKWNINSNRAKNPSRNKEIRQLYKTRYYNGMMLAELYGLSISQTYRIINGSKK